MYLTPTYCVLLIHLVMHASTSIVTSSVRCFVVGRMYWRARTGGQGSDKQVGESLRNQGLLAGRASLPPCRAQAGYSILQIWPLRCCLMRHEENEAA